MQLCDCRLHSPAVTCHARTHATRRYLESNQLATLPDGIFGSLDGLTELCVSVGAAAEYICVQLQCRHACCAAHVLAGSWRRVSLIHETPPPLCHLAGVLHLRTPRTRHTTRRKLSYNQLTTLPGGVFGDLFSLSILCVWQLAQCECRNVPSSMRAVGCACVCLLLVVVVVRAAAYA